MSKENSKIDINKHEIDIDTLKKQNVNDLLSIKELYRKLEEIEEKITQIKYIDSTLAKKLKKEYESLKKVIIDENVQIELNDKIEETKTELNEFGSHLDAIANKGTTVEVLERVTKEEIDRQIADGTIANLTIQDDSITPNHTTFFKEIKSKNLLNPSMIDWGTWLGNGLDGNTIDKVAGANASWNSTKAIEIEPNTTYVFQQDNNYMGSAFCNYCYWYDNEGNAIKLFDFSEPRTSPSNAKYVRIDFNSSGDSTKIYGLYKSTSKVLAEEYIEPYYKLDESYLPNSNDEETSTRVRTKNLFDPNEVVYDSYLNGGNLAGNSNAWKVTGFIKVEPNTKYYLSKEYVSHPIKYSFFYDEGKGVISEIPDSNPITTPSNCAYVRFSIQNGIDYIQFEKGAEVGYYIPYGYEDEYPKLLQSPLLGKKYCPIGDSITASGWGYELARQTGMIINNYNAIGGTTVSGAYDGATNMCGTTRINATPIDTDIITIMGGANDWSQQSQGNGIPVGELTDIKIAEDKKLDEITFCGCYKLMLNRLYKRCPNAQIFILEQTYRYLEETDRVVPLEEFREKTRQISYEYGYPLIQMKQKCGFNEMNYQDYYIDIIHPNSTTGRKRIIEVVKSGILSTIQ